jgi:hypothetical protein
MNSTVLYVSVDVGADVVVFADTNGDGTADEAVLLTGRALTDIAETNII